MSEQIKILVIDDDQVDRMAIGRMLRTSEFNLEVTEASDGVTALVLLKEKDFDCVFIDYRLPGENGLQILQKIKAVNSSVPVVMLTGYGDEQTAVEIMKAGASDYLAKDRISPESLKQSLRYALRVSRAEEQARLAEKSMRQNEVRMRAIFEGSFDAIITFDNQGEIKTFNPAAEKMFGYSQAEIRHQAIYLLMGYVSFNQLKTEGKGIITETTGRRKDGSCFIAELSLNKKTIEPKERFVCVVRDITQRKWLEFQDVLLYQMAMMVLAEKPLDQILDFICDQLSRLLDIKLAWIVLKEPDGSVRIGAKAGAIEADLYTHFFIWENLLEGRDPCTQAIESGQTQLLTTNEVRGIWQEQLTSCGIRSMAGFPLLIGRQVIGVLGIYSDQVSYFTRERNHSFENIAGQLAIAIHDASSRQQLKLLTKVMEAAANAIVITDPAGDIQWVNPAFCNLTGYSQWEVLGENSRLLKSGLQDRAFYQELWEHILCGHVWQGEMINRRKDGTLYAEEMTITPVRDEQGMIANFIAIKQDISVRKRAEEVLQRYHLLFKSVNDIILMMDTEGKILEANEAAEKIYGYSRQELLALKIIDLRASEDMRNYDEQFRRSFGGEFLFETMHRRKDGSCFPVEVSSLGVTQVAGSSLLLSVIRDISQRKRAEAEMLETQERLARVERLASLGTMAAGIAHEINQPLNSLKVIADGMIYWHNRGRVMDVARTMTNIQKISAQASRIDDIIKHMRSFVRTEKLNSVAPCNLNDAVEGALAMVGKQLSSHGIHVVKKTQSNLPPILGQETRLEEVVINLLINAMQSLDTVNQSTKEIICATWAEDKVILEVSDNGPGIKDEDRKRIFDPFFTTKPAGVGMGLGLAIIHTIVHSLGGQVYCKEQSGAGAVFRVEFPFLNDGPRCTWVSSH
ncbi:PAS domain S-box protein [Desulfotomaculum sp. 1211_IL3151]|uniref:PAS domain S-box protein n=1 Tax=Desulfotomaculum sp. 1211_IL3151 TaxID=3084055 RepID=UPI002FD95DF8